MDLRKFSYNRLKKTAYGCFPTLHYTKIMLGFLNKGEMSEHDT